MDRVKKPFAPGAGTSPPALVGRQEILENAQVTLARIKEGRPAKSFLLVGLRGVGKTVLLNRIQELAKASGYKAIFIEAPENKRLPALLIPPLAANHACAGSRRTRERIRQKGTAYP